MLDRNDFCKLLLLRNKNLIGFISIFPNDCDEEKELSPWYATMYVKKEYRNKGYSKMLNNAIIKEAKKRGFKQLYLKSELNNYYEKFDAQYIKNINLTEKLYKIVIK
jgi:GNAT superfamily N-acetyltransferase